MTERTYNTKKRKESVRDSLVFNFNSVAELTFFIIILLLFHRKQALFFSLIFSPQESSSREILGKVAQDLNQSLSGSKSSVVTVCSGETYMDEGEKKGNGSTVSRFLVRGKIDEKKNMDQVRGKTYQVLTT